MVELNEQNKTDCFSRQEQKRHARRDARWLDPSSPKPCQANIGGSVVELNEQIKRIVFHGKKKKSTLEGVRGGWTSRLGISWVVN